MPSVAAATRSSIDTAAAPNPPSLAVGQVQHIGCLAILLLLVWKVWTQLLGSPYPVEFWSLVAIAVIHQLWILVWWRYALQYQHQHQQQQVRRGGGSSIFEGGTNSVAFRIYKAGFAIFMMSRIVFTARLAWKDCDSLKIMALPRAIITLLLLIPSLYTGYSVNQYFGSVRAIGADHFDLKKYRNMPLVNQGIFQYTPNAMYKFVFLLFHAIAIAFNSSAALTTSLFQHAYIWLQFFYTEKPDMEYIYGSKKQ